MTDIEDGEIVDIYEKLPFRYLVEGNVLEREVYPSEIDTSADNTMLVQFTKDFEYHNHIIIQNAFVYSVVVGDGMININLGNKSYPIVVGEEEYEMVNRGERGEDFLQGVVVLDQELEVVSKEIRGYDGFEDLQLVSNGAGRVVFVGTLEIKWEKYFTLGTDTIEYYNDDEGTGSERSGIIYCYNYRKDSIEWYQHVGNANGAVATEIQRGPAGTIYVSMRSGEASYEQPYVYIGDRNHPTDSILMNGANMSTFYDYFMVKFSPEGEYVGSLTVNEGVYDLWWTFELDEESNVYINCYFYRDTLQVRDTSFVRQHIIRDEVGLTAGVLKFNAAGELEWGRFLKGNYLSSWQGKTTQGGNRMYLNSDFIGHSIEVNDTLLYGDTTFSKPRDFLYSLSHDGKEQKLLVSENDNHLECKFLREYNGSSDTLLMVPSGLVGTKFYDYTIPEDHPFVVLKVDFTQPLSTSSVDVPQLLDPSAISVFPNPVSASSEITITGLQGKQVESIRIYSSSGEQIKLYKEIDTMGEEQRLRIPSIMAGMYYLGFTTSKDVFIKPLQIH